MRKWLFALLVLSGCGDSGAKKDDSGILKDKTWEDVPAHSGLTYVEGVGKQNADFRSYKQLYKGDASAEAVRTFYKEALPAHGWAPASEDSETLTFTKKLEKCVIKISTGSDRKLEVLVTLSYKD